MRAERGVLCRCRSGDGCRGKNLGVVVGVVVGVLFGEEEHEEEPDEEVDEALTLGVLLCLGSKGGLLVDLAQTWSCGPGRA